MVNLSRQYRESSEVFLSSERMFSLDSNNIAELKAAASENRRKRIRFCSHASPDELVHEMLILQPQGVYIRPHLHLDKPESMLILEGMADYVTFDNGGEVLSQMSMGDYRSGRPFYQSTREAQYHTLIVRSEWLVFLEITKGPFRREDTVFAPWSPEDIDSTGVQQFMNRFEESVA